MDTARTACEVHRVKTPLSACAYRQQCLCEPNWQQLCKQTRQAVVWINPKLLRIVRHMKGEVVTLQAPNSQEFWCRSAIIKLGLEDI